MGLDVCVSRFTNQHPSVLVSPSSPSGDVVLSSSPSLWADSGQKQPREEGLGSACGFRGISGGEDLLVGAALSVAAGVSCGQEAENLDQKQKQISEFLQDAHCHHPGLKS